MLLSKSQRLLNGVINQLKFRSKDEYLVVDDISNGRENLKIPAVSYRRDDKAPDDYHYVTEFVEREPMNVDKSLKIMSPCACSTDCEDGRCNCTSYNKSGRYYDSKGCLAPEYDVSAPEIVYECNFGCKCNPKSCQNRVIQRGLRYKVALFRTKSRGWGVRTLETLRRGSFIGVYSGELITTESSWKRDDDTYLFNLTCCATIPQPPAVTEDPPAGEDQTNSDDAAEVPDEQQQQLGHTNNKVQFVCDAKFFGNFTRFINHSCEPNVIGVRSFTTHQDPRFPYIAFYTNKEVSAGSELTLNYGDNYWLVKCKRDSIYCLCKRSSCRFNKKTYANTLREYKRQKEKQQRQQ